MGIKLKDIVLLFFLHTKLNFDPKSPHNLFSKLFNFTVRGFESLLKIIFEGPEKPLRDCRARGLGARVPQIFLKL